MLHRLVALHHPDDAARRGWLDSLNPDAVLELGTIAVCSWGGALRASADGRAAGGLVGVLFNDLQIHGELTALGHAVAREAHDPLCVEEVGRFGPRGLGALRWQGVLAVAHRGQRSVLMAGDALGVGVLWCSRRGAALAVDSDPGDAEAGGTGGPERVPAGLALMLTEGGGRLVPWTPSEETAPFVRRPGACPWVRDAEAAGAEVGRRLGAALGATRRRLGPPAEGEDGPQAPLATLRAEAAGARERETGGGGGVETRARLCWTGAGDLLETTPWPPPWRALSDNERVEGLREMWRRRAGAVGHGSLSPPEPVARLSPARGARRWRRHVLTLPEEVTPAWSRGASAGRLRVWPHLDPAVIAALGALPDAALRELAWGAQGPSGL